MFCRLNFSTYTKVASSSFNFEQESCEAIENRSSWCGSATKLGFHCREENFRLSRRRSSHLFFVPKVPEVYKPHTFAIALRNICFLNGGFERSSFFCFSISKFILFNTFIFRNPEKLDCENVHKL